MGLYAELQRPLPTFRFRFAEFPQLRILAEKLDRKYGGAPAEFPPAEDALARIKHKLALSGGDLRTLTPRERRKVHWIIWSAPEGWSEDHDFMERYLAWADRVWGRFGVRCLWARYVTHFDRRSLATQMLASWLQVRREKLPPRLADFSKEWRIFDVETAPGRAAVALIKNDELAEQLESLGVAIRHSAFMCSVLETVGQLLLTNTDFKTGLPDRLIELLGPLGEYPIQQMEARDGHKAQATGVLVEGLVRWSERQSDTEIQAETLRCLDVIVGDPRLHSLRWRPVRDEIKETVIRWLSRLNLETFIKIMDELQTNKPAQWQARRVFWEQYLPWIKKSWLVVGPDAKRIANRMLKESYGEFLRAQPDHCGLMMQIGELVIFEMNKNGSALFWEAGDEKMPQFFRTKEQYKYNRKQIIDLCHSLKDAALRGASRFRLTHPPTKWKTTFRQVISDRTGIRP